MTGNKIKIIAIFSLYTASILSLFASEEDLGRDRKRGRSEPIVKLTPDTKESLAGLVGLNPALGGFVHAELAESRTTAVTKRFDEHILKDLYLTPENMLFCEGYPESRLAASAGSADVQEYLARRYLSICENLTDNPRGVTCNKSHPNYESYRQNFERLRENWMSQTRHKAFEWIRKAYEQGSTSAKMWLGYMLYRGFVKYSDATLESNRVRQAVYLWRLAADQEDIVSQYLMGLSCESGIGGVSVNVQEAVSWYGKAEKKGHEGARLRLRGLLPSLNGLSAAF